MSPNITQYTAPNTNDFGFYGMPYDGIPSKVLKPKSPCLNNVGSMLRKAIRTTLQLEKQDIILESLTCMGLADPETKDLKPELKEVFGDIHQFNKIAGDTKKISRYISEVMNIINDDISIFVKACDTIQNNPELTKGIRDQLKSPQGQKQLAYAAIQSMLLDHILEKCQKNPNDRLVLYKVLGHDKKDNIFNLIQKVFSNEELAFAAGVKQFAVDLAYHTNNKRLPEKPISAEEVSRLLSTNVWMMTFPLTDKAKNNQQIGRKLSEVPVSKVEWDQKEVAITMGSGNCTQEYNQLYLAWNTGVVTQSFGDEWLITLTKLLNKAILKRVNSKEFMDPRLTALKLTINWYHNKQKNNPDYNPDQEINPEMVLIINKIASDILPEQDILEKEALSKTFKNLNHATSIIESLHGNFMRELNITKLN